MTRKHTIFPYAALLLALSACNDGNEFGDGYQVSLGSTSISANANAGISVSPTTLTFSATSAAAQTVSVTASASWTVKTEATWLTLSKTSGTGSDTFTVTAADNNDTTDRSATITLTCGEATTTVSVIQENILKVWGSLTAIMFIDNAVRLSWNIDDDAIHSIKAVPTTDTGAPTITAYVSSATFEKGYIDVYGLKPETVYSVYAYKDSITQDNSTYAGCMTGTTLAAPNFDEKYGAGKWLDIRNWDEKEAKDTLKTVEFWAAIPDGAAIILRGEQEYKVNNSVKFNGSYTFVTGPTLGGNARFISSGGLTCASGASIQKLQFEDIDFISDKALTGGSNEIATNTDKGFGGRQVFNNNGTNSTVEELVFKNCSMTGYRSIVRVQNANDAIQKLTFKGCTINGVGDQGVVTTNNKAADWRSVTFDDCTITNIVMLCDLRATAGEMTFTVKNCTFCYAPIETTSNKNTPLFRFGSNGVTLNIQNTFFGPSMASTGSTGDDVLTYQAGTAGSILLDNQEAQVSVTHSFKTKYDWTLIVEATYPIDALTELNMTETELWKAPAEGDFTVIGNVGETGIGASKWQQ